MKIQCCCYRPPVQEDDHWRSRETTGHVVNKGVTAPRQVHDPTFWEIGRIRKGVANLTLTGSTHSNEGSSQPALRIDDRLENSEPLSELRLTTRCSVVLA